MLDVWEDAFGIDYAGGEALAQETLKWQLLEAKESTRRWGWVAIKEQETVGAWLSLPVNLRIHGKPAKANWLMSTAIATKQKTTRENEKKTTQKKTKKTHHTHHNEINCTLNGTVADCWRFRRSGDS